MASVGKVLQVSRRAGGRESRGQGRDEREQGAPVVPGDVLHHAGAAPGVGVEGALGDQVRGRRQVSGLLKEKKIFENVDE